MAIVDAAFVIQHDRELIKSGLKLHQRPFHVAIAWVKDQGFSGSLLDDAIWMPLMSIYRELYPSGDFSMPALFESGVALRDQMYKVRVNVGHGKFSINPIDCIEISKQELNVIFRLEPEQFWMAFYGVVDVIDFAYGTDDLIHTGGDASELLSNARSSIAATARILQCDLDIDSTVQTTCLAAELTMKGALAHLGWTEARYRKLSHRFLDTADALIKERPRSSDPQLRAACAAFPDYVGTRYKSHGMTRHELMMLAMRTQFVAADAMRRVTERDFSSQFETDNKIPPRVFP